MWYLLSKISASMMSVIYVSRLAKMIKCSYSNTADESLQLRVVLFTTPASGCVRYLALVQQRALKTGAPIPGLLQEAAGGSSAGSTGKVLWTNQGHLLTHHWRKIFWEIQQRFTVSGKQNYHKYEDTVISFLCVHSPRIICLERESVVQATIAKYLPNTDIVNCHVSGVFVTEYIFLLITNGCKLTNFEWVALRQKLRSVFNSPVNTGREVIKDELPDGTSSLWRKSSLLPTRYQCDVNCHSTATDYHSDENRSTATADLKINLVWAWREGKGKERFPKIGCVKCFHFLFLRCRQLCWYQKDFNLLSILVILASRFAVLTDWCTCSLLWTCPCVTDQST